MTIISTWQSSKDKLVKLTINMDYAQLVKQSGEYCIYKANDRHFVYTYKRFAFNELCGLNIEHFNNVVNNVELKPENQMFFLHHRAMETIRKINTLS